MFPFTAPHAPLIFKLEVKMPRPPPQRNLFGSKYFPRCPHQEVADSARGQSRLSKNKRHKMCHPRIKRILVPSAPFVIFQLLDLSLDASLLKSFRECHLVSVPQTYPGVNDHFWGFHQIWNAHSHFLECVLEAARSTGNLDTFCIFGQCLVPKQSIFSNIFSTLWVILSE